MPFPYQFGREESDKKSLQDALPKGMKLFYTVKPWLTFDVALEVDRVQKKVWVVVYSARYPMVFDLCLPELVDVLKDITRADFPLSRVAVMHNYKRPDFYRGRDNEQLPKCRACFDCVAYIDEISKIPFGVNCDECGNSGGEGNPGERDTDGNYTCAMDLDKMEKKVRKGVLTGARHFMDNNRLCNTCKRRENVKHVKRCSRCKNVFYCSRECQVRDWPNHKPFCKKSSETVSTSLLSPFLASSSSRPSRIVIASGPEEPSVAVHAGTEVYAVNIMPKPK